MIQENDLVSLLVNLPHLNLSCSDVGTVAYCYESGNTFEVEFVDAKGTTIGVETLGKDQISKVAIENVIFHVRKLAEAA